MTAQELIKASLRLIGAIATGETPTADEIQDGLEAMNIMLGSWSDDRLMIHVITEDTLALTSGTASYSIGSAGDIDTERPIKIQSAFTRQSNLDVPLRIRGQAEYNAIAQKSDTGIPSILYYNPGWTTGTIYLAPTPGAGLTLYLYSLKAFAAKGGGDLVTTITSTVSFPPGYIRAIKYNLAIELAPEYGKSVSPEVALGASESKGSIKRINAANQVEAVKLEIMRVASRFSIDNC